MLACCAQEEEGRESQEAERVVKANLFLFAHPEILGARAWFASLRDGLDPNEVYNAASSKGFGPRYCTGFKILYQYRKTEAFRRLTEE
ncbi:MAG: hypothetical protein HYT31_02980 [Parcubacteria group bacterium]|nr:hypothetical protein [Parcubacteria group bacterium]